MARERMITRTVTEVIAEVMCVEVSTATVSMNSYRIAGKYADTSAIMEALKPVYETGNFKLVACIKFENTETLYGMPEDEFIKYAKVLPPR